MKKRLNKKGFTLIELIVVIAILGILAAIAIPRLSGFTNKAQISADKATFETITKSIAIGVADGTILSNVTLATTTGTVVFTGTEADAVTGMFEAAPVFKLKGNQTLTAIVWAIADGEITPPNCNSGTGQVTN